MRPETLNVLALARKKADVGWLRDREARRLTAKATRWQPKSLKNRRKRKRIVAMVSGPLIAFAALALEFAAELRRAERVECASGNVPHDVGYTHRGTEVCRACGMTRSFADNRLGGWVMGNARQARRMARKAAATR